MSRGSNWLVSNKIQSNYHSCHDKESSGCHSILLQRAGGWGYCRSVPSPSAQTPLAPVVWTRAGAAVCVFVHNLVKSISTVVVLAIIYIILRIANYIQTHPKYYTLEYSHFSDSIRSKFLYMIALGIAARNSTKCSRRIPRNDLMCISVILQN